MTTFVNVGLNNEIAEALAERPEFAWAAWDSYRRFLQSWAMSEGVSRDFFDAIMTGFKSRYGVEQKLEFPAEQMRKIAFAYKVRAEEEGVAFVDDPFEQVVSCISKVLASWEAPDPRLYRAVHRHRRGVGHRRRRSAHGLRQSEPWRPGPASPSRAAPSSRTAPRCDSSATSRVAARARTWSAGSCSRCPSRSRSALASPHVPGTLHQSLEEGLPRDLPRPARGRARSRRRARHGSARDRVHFRVAVRRRPVHPAEARRRAGAAPGDPRTSTPTSPNYGPPVAVGMGVAGGAYIGRAAVNAQQIDPLARRCARRRHRPPASGHSARRTSS